jgi:RNA polymerase sigma-70 factor (ECF subfamily)
MNQRTSFFSRKSFRSTSHREPYPAAEVALDRELVRRYTEGDESAFVEIVERHRGKVFNIVLRLLRNHADAEEITQDTFIRAHRGLAAFRGDSSLATWLFCIAVNLAHNRYWYFFRRHRQDSLSLDFVIGADNDCSFSELIADSGSDPSQLTATGEFEQLIERCLGKLEPDQRDILSLRISDRPYDEIAEILRLKVGTVKSRIARARSNLRRLILEACPEFGADTLPGDWLLPTRATQSRLGMAQA